jgi:DNA-directed RNA polymerase specialized sigma24 family protein
VGQQAFILFCELLEEWDPDRVPFTRYLMKMVKWRALHHVRRCAGGAWRYRLVRVTVAEEEGGGLAEPESHDAALDILNVEDRVDWEAHTEGLDERWKRIIALKFRQEVSAAEIAVVDGRSRRTINRELRAALSALRARLEEEWESCG